MSEMHERKTCSECGANYEGRLEYCPLDGTVLQAVADPFLGRLLGGRYRVLAPIGRGSSARVYRGRQDPVGREVAIKIFIPRREDAGLLEQRFLREAKVADRVKHRNVIEITDVGTTDEGRPYLVTELLDGAPLQTGVRHGEAYVARIGRQIARALETAHQLGVLHRDIKPANLFIDPNGKVTVLDFGLARALDDLSLTESGMLMGTPTYMAPELAARQRGTGASDIYALGVVLFEMMVGRPPYQGSVPEVLRGHLLGRPGPVRALVPEVSDMLDELLDEMLQKVPAERPTAGEVARCLETISRAARPPNTRPSESRPPASPATESSPPAPRLTERHVPDSASHPSPTAGLAGERSALRQRIDDCYAGSAVPEHTKELMDELEAELELLRRLDAATSSDEVGVALEKAAATTARALADAQARFRDALEQLSQVEARLVTALADEGARLGGAVTPDIAHAVVSRGLLAEEWLRVREAVIERRGSVEARTEAQARANARLEAGARAPGLAVEEGRQAVGAALNRVRADLPDDLLDDSRP